MDLEIKILVWRKLSFFGQNCMLPILFLKKPWYPCPFEILAEALVKQVQKRLQVEMYEWNIHLRLRVTSTTSIIMALLLLPFTSFSSNYNESTLPP
jgi:hypothetical protein